MRRFGILVLAAALVAGCGGRKRAPVPLSAEEAVKTFVEALKAGDHSTAAELFDYNAYGSANNEDWKDLGEGTRTQIINKLKQEKADQLKAQFGSASDLSYAAQGSQGDQGGQTVYALTSGGRLVGKIAVRQAGSSWRLVYEGQG